MLLAITALRGGCVDAWIDVYPFLGEEVRVDVEANLSRQAEETGLAHCSGRCEGYNGCADVEGCLAESVGVESNIATAAVLKI